MSVYLHQRLLSWGRIAPEVLIEAFAVALVQKSSLVEALVGMDARFGIDIADCFERDGETADLAWRPDPRLLMDLPPGICDRYLAFPFRERAGAVEVATISPLESAIQKEFEVHFGRAVVLFRGSVQALLAAAGAAVDLNELNYHLSQPPPSLDEAPIPLVRKSLEKEPPRERTPTSPGMGRIATRPGMPPRQSMPVGTARPPTWVSPYHIDAEQMEEVDSFKELCAALSTALPAPALVFELGQGRLTLRAASGPGAYGEEIVSLVSDSAFTRAVEEGSYVGPWYENPVHERFATSFPSGAFVRVERIGTADSGLLVTMAGDFDVHRAAELLRKGAERWRAIVEELD